jgi:hypothetical protein
MSKLPAEIKPKEAPEDSWLDTASWTGQENPLDL